MGKNDRNRGGNWDGNMRVLAMVEEEKLDNHFSKHVPTVNLNVI